MSNRPYVLVWTKITSTSGQKQGCRVSTLADRVKGRLEERGERVYEAAEKAGIGYGTLQGIVTGKRRNPSRDVIEKLAAYLGVEVGWLLGFGDDEGLRRGVELFSETRPVNRVDLEFHRAFLLEAAGRVLIWGAGQEDEAEHRSLHDRLEEAAELVDRWIKGEVDAWGSARPMPERSIDEEDDETAPAGRRAITPPQSAFPQAARSSEEEKKKRKNSG